MKIDKFIEQLQEISDQYNGKIDVVIEYKLRNKVMINSRPKVYTKCIYYKEPRPIHWSYGLLESWKMKVIISNRVMLYKGKYLWKSFKLWENKI